MDEFDVIVIGAGPGGYVAAIRASQLGLINLISAVQHALQNRFAVINAYILMEVRHGGRTVSVLMGFARIPQANNTLTFRACAF